MPANVFGSHQGCDRFFPGVRPSKVGSLSAKKGLRVYIGTIQFRPHVWIKSGRLRGVQGERILNFSHGQVVADLKA